MLYLTSDRLPIFLPLGLIGFYRYLWYLIRLAAFLVYRPIPIPQNPSYLPERDVTIIVPTIDADDNFLEAAKTWLLNEPAEIIIVTASHMLENLQKLAREIQDSTECRTSIRVLAIAQANKRKQMAAGIRAATNEIIVFADDDALWPKTLLASILACFEDQQIGGVGASQKVKPVGEKMTVWEVLAAMRLSIRNVEIAASTHIDGGVPCLSGRTAAYRSIILKDPDFIYGFTNDYWLEKYLLNSGDDKFLTRWLVSHGWNTYIQCCPEAELLSTMKPDSRFLKQVLRWTRNTWRSDLRSIFIERHVWTRHPYVAYMMIDKFLNPITLLMGPILVLVLCIKGESSASDSATGTVYRLPAWNVLLSWIGWLLITRSLKLAPHLYNRPQDIVFIPAWLIFGYYFAIMKIYTLFTLHEVGWGTRQLSDESTGSKDQTEVRSAKVPPLPDKAPMVPEKDARTAEMARQLSQYSSLSGSASLWSEGEHTTRRRSYTESFITSSSDTHRRQDEERSEDWSSMRDDSFEDVNLDGIASPEHTPKEQWRPLEYRKSESALPVQGIRLVQRVPAPTQ